MAMLLLLLLLYIGIGYTEMFATEGHRRPHLLADVGESLLRKIVARTDTNRARFVEIFNTINIIRNVGSVGHETVRKNHTWNVELDSFSENTVIGPKTFHNIIASFGPSRPRSLILACHYESKLMPNFVGSTDSALPCSIILLLTELLSADMRKQLKKRCVPISCCVQPEDTDAPTLVSIRML